MTRHTNEDRELTALLRQFGKEEDGLVTIFACFMIFCMMMIGGIGVDMMRHEMDRTRAQACTDRAVLAAADLDQELDPEAVVRDYLDNCGMAEYTALVDVDQGLNYRTVTVDASADINTQFMDFMGVDTLTVPAVSSAEEKVNKVEISMVLDISGSMNEGSKMQNLKDAASTFVDAVLVDSNEDLVSVSLVPYSQHVNAGPDIFNELNVFQLHNYSHCVEFPDSEYGTTALDTSMYYDHMQHFQWNWTSIESGSQLNTLYDTVCPREAYERILPTSQDAGALKAQIAQLKPRAGTQIFMGMKWGAAMLDPSFQDINFNLSNQGVVDSVFATRPAPYEDEETLKTVILMTDGQNSSAVRIANSVYARESHYVHWNNWNFQYYLQYYVRSYDRNRWYYQKYSEAAGDGLLEDICDAAKEENIVIWSIGFEVTDHGANVMRDCASSPSHFFRVEGVEISEAFSSIARQINQLRLTQ